MMTFLKQKISVLLILLSSSINIVAANAEDVAAQAAAIASAHPLATQAGHTVLHQGGNAFDAAVAVAAALAVVEPYGSGLGGGGFFLLRRQDDGFETMIDAREVAPAAASADMYLDKKGNAISDLSRNGPLAAGIPGLPAALVYMAREYGELPLTVSLAPAITYAREGFEVSEIYRKLVGYRLALLQKYPASAATFLDKGKLPEVGYKIVQVALANTLEQIANKGFKGFYKGKVAASLVSSVRAAGGIWTKKDLSAYRVIEREPMRGEYKGMRITSAALPSSGGLVMISALNMLANYDLQRLPESQQIHLIVEAMRRAYRDRAEYMGDSDYVDVPIARLLNTYYAAGLAASIRTDRATPSASLPGAVGVQQGDNTTHFSIQDKQGNRVAATLSINFPFGSGFMDAKSGILLNNEMDDFAAKAGVPNGYGLVAGKTNPNAVQPGKRMLSSMTPTFLETDKRLAIIGTPGGSRIITMVLLSALDFYAGGTAESMVALPRFHHQFLPDVISFEEDALSRDEQLELQLLGHQLQPMTRRYGNMQVVIWDKENKVLTAASDPRGEGLAEVR